MDKIFLKTIQNLIFKQFLGLLVPPNLSRLFFKNRASSFFLLFDYQTSENN